MLSHIVTPHAPTLDHYDHANFEDLEDSMGFVYNHPLVTKYEPEPQPDEIESLDAHNDPDSMFDLDDWNTSDTSDDPEFAEPAEFKNW